MRLIGREPRFLARVFEILQDLQKSEGKTIHMVEQTEKKGLAVTDISYVLVSGQVAIAGIGDALPEDPQVGRLFIGGLRADTAARRVDQR